ncbi:SP family sugar:H+ symporter-like MFS transporter [Rhodopirellula rubra]|uniref:SP family sugar:H+ symporter-like MFS transporter n=1 Tax=Aporhodopirellula rubra TaxID=980271 RepID=A0A7W5DY11_9BACT|nr:sugar porter family MFS transporter [Aporhodopirellula rubra]MBB3206173.1 SP family sugar:H+ symporter-like MFS transporter [Aporhodopirellula rubra]
MTQVEHKNGFVILITLVATIGGFLFGFDSGVINGTVDGLRTTFQSDSAVTGFAVASMLLGCAAGAFAAGRMADRFGRRNILLLSAAFFTLSAWGSGIAHGPSEFMAYRILGGLAVGAASVLAPAYISEVAPAKYRGALSSIQQIAIIGGLFLAFLSNYAIANAAGSSLSVFAWGFEAWRWMFWVELIPAAAFFFALLLIPESPRFLVATGQKERSLGVLKKLMGDHAQAKYDEIESSLSSDHHRPRFRDILGTYGFRPIVWVGIFLAAFQQFVGINVIFYYGSVLWQSAGFDESNALLINVISGAVSIAACFAALVAIDRMGRKPMLVIGSVGMLITLAVMAFVFNQSDVAEDGSLSLTDVNGKIALIAANMYVVFFNFSWGPVVWVLLGEMFPNQLRGSALAVSGISMWGANFIVTISFPLLLANIGLGGAYFTYAICAFLSLFLVLRFVSETKGLELEQMQG